MVQALPSSQSASLVQGGVSSTYAPWQTDPSAGQAPSKLKRRVYGPGLNPPVEIVKSYPGQVALGRGLKAPAGRSGPRIVPGLMPTSTGAVPIRAAAEARPGTNSGGRESIPGSGSSRTEGASPTMPATGARPSLQVSGS